MPCQQRGADSQSGGESEPNPDCQQAALFLSRLANRSEALERRADSCLLGGQAGARLPVRLGGDDAIQGRQRVLELAKNPDGLGH